MKEPFFWDNYSDQPYQLKDKTYKKQMRKRELFSLIKTVFTALFILPFSILMVPFIKRKVIDSSTFFSMGVDYEREPEQTLELLDALGVQRVLLRFKLWEIGRVDALKKFIVACGNKKITLKIIQDREHIEDLELLKKRFTHSIFSA